jgi:NAD(P)-dependent dehydrogenase (short-subunit alcohol dehydrogenase family)
MKTTPVRGARAEALFRLDGKTAIVTGASRGIGEGCARLLAALGAHVVLVARDAGELERLHAAIKEEGGSAECWPLDLSSRAGFDARVAQMPALDILVNNLGMNIPQPFLQVDEASFDRVMNLNVKANFFCAQAAAGRMAGLGRRGSIVMITSQAGHVALPDRTVYCASKFAMEGMSKAMALALAPLGIRVNSVAPTFVQTPMIEPFLKDPQFREYVEASIPLGRMASIDEVAAAVAYLASPVAAIVTGTSLMVDGGWTMK